MKIKGFHTVLEYFFLFPILLLLIGNCLTHFVGSNNLLIYFIVISTPLLPLLLSAKIPLNRISYAFFIGVAIVLINFLNLNNNQAFIDKVYGLKNFLLLIPLFVAYKLFLKNQEKLEHRISVIIQVLIIFIFLATILSLLGFSREEEVVTSTGVYIKQRTILTIVTFESILVGFYFFSKHLTFNSRKQLLYAIVFLSIPHFAALEIQRGILLSTILCVFFAIFWKYNYHKSMSKKIILYILTPLITPVALFFLYRIPFVYEKFRPIIELLNFNLVDVKDPSLTSRLLEINIVFDFIGTTSFFGYGYYPLSQAKFIFPERFFLEDIGLFGIYFTLGFFGIFIFLIQFLWAFKYVKHFRNNSSVLLKCSTLLYLFYLVYTFSTGKLIHHYGLFVLIIILLESVERNIKLQDKR